MAQPDETAALVSWLGSDEASHVNGAVVSSRRRPDELVSRQETGSGAMAPV